MYSDDLLWKTHTINFTDQPNAFGSIGAKSAIG